MPDFEAIAAAGRSRRRRRHAVIGAAAACVLGASGLLAATGDDSPVPDPAGDVDEPSLVTPYPGVTSTTLEQGRYEIRPFADPSLPAVRFTLPPGWNSWVGPNRFDGLSDEVTGVDGSNRKAIDRDPEWLLGMLVLEPRWVAQPGCTMIDVRDADVATLVRSLQDIPRLRLTSGPQHTTRTGFPAVHLRLREKSSRDTCRQDSMLDTTQGGVSYVGSGTTIDAWVIDVDGRPLLVWAAWTATSPIADVQDLLGIVDSVEVHDR
jgi:hypothetical protein